MGLQDKIRIIKRRLITDSRGWFLKVLDGKEEGLPNYTGEIYITNAVVGESKGGHFHNQANEWFTLLSGECNLYLKDVQTDERLKIFLTGKNPETIYVPFGIAHIFTNVGETEFTLLAYSDQLFDPADTIPYTDFEQQ